MLDVIRAVVRRRDDTGASGVEYGLLIAAIAAVVIAVMFALGQVVQDAFDDTCSNLNTQQQAQANCPRPAD